MVAQDDASFVVKTHLKYVKSPPETVDAQVWAGWQYFDSGARIEARYWLKSALAEDSAHADAQRLIADLDATGGFDTGNLLSRSRVWLDDNSNVSVEEKEVVMQRIDFLEKELFRKSEVQKKIDFSFFLPILLTIIFLFLAARVIRKQWQ